MGSNDVKQCRKDIDRFTKNLIRKAKRCGLYENFGNDECMALRHKYDIYDRVIGSMIKSFSDWCMEYTGA